MFSLRGTVISIIFIFILVSSAFAATDVVEVVWGILEKGDIEYAEEKVDEYLEKYPDDVDVLMMKGNVVFRKALTAYGAAVVGVNPNESIYDTSIGYIGEPTVVVPEEVAREVAGYWLKALSIDNTRGDIHRGLCYVYSTAMMKEELVERLGILGKEFPEEEKLKFTMGDYARMFDERGRFEDGIDVYKEISRLYPESGDVLSDIAAMYFGKGDIENAASYFAKALKKKGSDAMTLENAALMYSIKGDYGRVPEILKTLSGVDPKNREWMLYEGLVGRMKGSDGWRGRVEGYIEGGGGDDLELAQFLSEAQEETPEGYLEAVGKVKNSMYLFLLHERAMKSFPAEFKPVFNLAELLTYYNNHEAAIRLYEKIQEKELYGDEEKEKFHFYYAWSLYSAGRAEKSLKIWKTLLESDDFYVKSAAAYFSGKYYEEKGDTEQALKHYRLVSGDASDSKYATYSWNKVNALSGK
jgi:tetratricopeptide (TPR) repeat protein